MWICKSLSPSVLGPDADPFLNCSRFAFSDGFNSSPLPFRCSITPRSAHRVEIIEKEFEEAMKELQVYSAKARGRA